MRAIGYGDGVGGFDDFRWRRSGFAGPGGSADPPAARAPVPRPVTIDRARDRARSTLRANPYLTVRAVPGRYTVETIVAGQRRTASAEVDLGSALEPVRNVRTGILDLTTVRALWDRVSGADVDRVCVAARDATSEGVLKCVWSDMSQVDVRYASRVDLDRPSTRTRVPTRRRLMATGRPR